VPFPKHAVPASSVSDGDWVNVQRNAVAFATVASHSVLVGKRHSPADEPSDRPQSPLLSVAAACSAAFQFDSGKQSARFSQIRPVSRSVTVPFPQST
jgi:hypothetical protein